jgi:hypothetical protein
VTYTKSAIGALLRAWCHATDRDQSSYRRILVTA